MDYLVPLWVRQYLTQRQRREIPEDVADHLLAICAEALQDRDPATLSHPRTHSILQSFAAILRQRSTSSFSSSTLRSKFPFGSTVGTFRKLAAMDLDPLNSQEIVRLAIYVMKRSTLEFVDPLTSERVHTEGERKNILFRVGNGVNNNSNNTASGSKTGGLAAAADVYLGKDFNIGQSVLHNPSVPVSRAVQSVLSLALFCARASGLRSKNEPPPSATRGSYPLTAAASMAGAKWLAKLGQVMFGGPCSQAGHNHHRRTRASLDLLERQNIELGHKILEEQKQAGLLDLKSGQSTIRRPSVVQSALTPPETRIPPQQGGGNKDLGGSSSSTDFVPLSSLSHSTSASTLSTTSGVSSASGGPGLEKWCRHCSRAMSCLVLAQLQETLGGGLEDVGFDDSGFVGTTSLTNSGFELLHEASRSSSSSSLSRMDVPSQSTSSMASSFMGVSGAESAGSGSSRHRGYRDPRPHLEHKSDLVNRLGGTAVAADRPTSPFILFDRSHIQDENEPPSSIPSPLLEPSSEGRSALKLSLADAFGSEMATGLHGRAMLPQMNSNNQIGHGLGQQSEGDGSPIHYKKFTQSNPNAQDTNLDIVSRRLGNDSKSHSGHSSGSSHPLQHAPPQKHPHYERAESTSSREDWERMVVEPQKTQLELDLEQAVADSTPLMTTTAAVATTASVPVAELPSVTREQIADAKAESRTNVPSAMSAAAPVGLGLDQRLSQPADMSSSSEDPKENRSPVASASAGDDEEEDGVPAAAAKLNSPRPRGSSPSVSAGSSPVSPATEGVADPILPAQDHREAVPQNNVVDTGGENSDDRADVTEGNATQENEAKPSGSPSSSTSLSSSPPSASSSSSDSSASSFRSATQPNSPVSDRDANEEADDDDHRAYSGSDLDSTSRPHTPGEYPWSPQPLQTTRMSRKDEEESSDEDSEVEVDDEVDDDADEDNEEDETVEDKDDAKTPSSLSPSSSFSSSAVVSPKGPTTPEHRRFYTLGLHGQASTDAYAREIEQSMARKTPPQDSGRTSRRGSEEAVDNDETTSSLSIPIDESKNPDTDNLEENVTSEELQATASERDKSSGTQKVAESNYTTAALPVKETLTLKESATVATTEQVNPASESHSSNTNDKDPLVKRQELSPPSSTESGRRPLSFISNSSSLLSEDPNLASSSPTIGEDDSEHSADELDDEDEEDDYLNSGGGGDGDGFASDLSSGAMASSSSLLSSSSSLPDTADPTVKGADQKRQKLQRRHKKRLLVDDAKRKQDQLDKIKAQLQLKTLGKIRQQVSFWEEKGVLEQKVVGVVEVEDEPTEESSKQIKDHVDHPKAENVPSSAPPTSPQRN